jgi:radical SAM superfamily enzyme YgiQ (UPF0313 family)
MTPLSASSHGVAGPRVLFVVPPSGLYRRDDRCQSRVEDQAVRVVLPPLDLALLAAVARLAGSVPRIADYPAEGRSWDDYRRDLADWRPQAVVLGVTTATLDGDLEAARIAKADNPAVRTLARGEVFERAGEKILADCPALDIAFAGEAEEVLGRFLQGESPETLEGAVYRPAAFGLVAAALIGSRPEARATSRPEARATSRPEARTTSRPEARATRRPEARATSRPEARATSRPEARATSVARTPGRAFVTDLGTLPIPARDLLDNALYRSPENNQPITVVKANRGCFAHCIYCPAGSLSDYRLRVRPVASVVAEVRECVERFGIRDFLFDGDTFTANKPWLLELCARLAVEHLPIRWGCNSRVDTMDEERARALAAAGCILVAFGVESGDQAMLDHMRKGTRVEQAERAVAACRAAGLATHAFYIIGLPAETAESLDRTLNLMRRLDTDLFDINIATPLPGTEYYDMAVAEGLLVGALGSYAHAMVRSRTLSAEYLTRWRRRALLRLYARPHYIAHILARAWRLGLTRHYVRAALGRLRTLLR